MIPWYVEILYIVITIAVVGYVFSGVIRFPKPQTTDSLINRYRIFNWEEFKWGVIIASPGVILHEMGHKFIGLSFGLNAQYEIWITGLIIGVVLRALNTGFIMLAPGFVVIAGATSYQSAATAFAGPAVNLILWLGSYAILKYHKKLTSKTEIILMATEKINMWLFIFNMIPIPPLDGSKVFAPLINLLF